MNTYAILITASIIFIISFNIFIYLLWNKINKLEKIIIDLFKKRNNQIITIYWITKNTLVKHNEIFENFLELKNKDFWEDSYNTWLEHKFNLYKKIHNELNFIFKICEKHRKISDNARYVYIKDSILEKSEELWDKIQIYKNITKNYKFLIKISKIMIVWFFISK